MKKLNWKLLGEIFICFFKLGSISFGGGYSIIPLMEREITEKKKWVDSEKIVDIFAVSESLPGAVALNSSAFVGYSIAGTPGTIAALLGNMTPSIIIVLSLSLVLDKVSGNPYVLSIFKGITPAIVGLISYAALKIGKTATVDWLCVLFILASFAAMTFLHMDPITVIVTGALLGIALTLFKPLQNLKNKMLFKSKKGE